MPLFKVTLAAPQNVFTVHAKNKKEALDLAEFLYDNSSEFFTQQKIERIKEKP